MAKKALMPVMFVGHGSPMNAIEDNEFSRGWIEAGKRLPKPKAILCISAHWETWGTMVTSSPKPETIHDFGGFPKALYRIEYPAPRSKSLADETIKAIKTVKVSPSEKWGLDHGCWSVLSRMFPEADVPVVQLSLDSSQPASFHYALAEQLMPLREKGILIIGSGNMVHNLYEVSFETTGGFDWALEANEILKKLITGFEHAKLQDYASLGKAVRLAVPTPEHYLPMLYALALRGKNEELEFFNDKAVYGSLTMTSFRIG